MLRHISALAFSVLLVAQAPIPKPSQHPAPAENQMLGPAEARGTEQFPVVVKVMPAERTQAEVAEEKAKEREGLKTETRLADLTGDLAAYTWKLFIATAFLAALTAGLLVIGLSQAREAKRMITATEIAAYAARDSARVAVTQMKPHVSVSARALQRLEPGGPFIVWCNCVNSGGSPAYRSQILSGVDFCPFPLTERIPLQAVGVDRNSGNFDLPVSSDSTGRASSRPMTYAPSPAQMQDWRAGKAALYVFGTFFFETDFGESVEVDYCQYVGWEQYELWLKNPVAQAGGVAPAIFRVAPFGNDTRTRRKEGT